MGFNINDYVWVRLTEDGLRRHVPSEWETVGDGWYRFQLWDLMAIYGRHLYNGAQAMFENNEIHFTEPTDAE